MLATILTGTARTQALADFAQKVTEVGGLDKLNDKDLRTELSKFVGVPHKTTKLQKIAIAENILTELQDRQQVESENIFEIGQKQVIEQTAVKLLACLTNTDGCVVAAMPLLDFFGSQMVKYNYAPTTMRRVVTFLRNSFIEQVQITYGNSVEFSRKDSQFIANDHELEVKLNTIYGLIYSRLEGLFKIEVIEYTNNKSVELKDQNTKTTSVDFSLFNSLIASVKQIVTHQCKTNKTDWKKVTLFLCLVTGRRVVEVLSGYSEFTKVDTYSVLFKGQAKDKSEAEREAYVIPTLVEADYVIAGIQWLADFKKLIPCTDTTAIGLTKHRELIHNRVSSDLNKYIKELFNDQFKLHDLRKVYACTCRCFLYDNTTNDSTENVYVATILGHGTEVNGKFVVDLGTAVSYSIYRVTNYNHRQS